MQRKMQVFMAMLCVASAERPSVCFTAHGQSELHCTQPPVEGPLAVYDDSATMWSFQTRGRTFHFRRNLLCEDRRCRVCLRPGGQLGKCKRSAASWPVVPMRANADLPRPRAILFSLALVLVPLAALLEVLVLGASPARLADAAQPRSLPVQLAMSLVRFASAWWFPWLAALGTALNMFTIVFTAATVIVFLAALLGRPTRWRSTAIANALGAAAGSALLLYFLHTQGGAIACERNCL